MEHSPPVTPVHGRSGPAVDPSRGASRTRRTGEAMGSGRPDGTRRRPPSDAPPPAPWRRPVPARLAVVRRNRVVGVPPHPVRVRLAVVRRSRVVGAPPHPVRVRLAVVRRNRVVGAPPHPVRVRLAVVRRNRVVGVPPHPVRVRLAVVRRSRVVGAPPHPVRVRLATTWERDGRASNPRAAALGKDRPGEGRGPVARGGRTGDARLAVIWTKRAGGALPAVIWTRRPLSPPRTRASLSAERSATAGTRRPSNASCGLMHARPLPAGSAGAMWARRVPDVSRGVRLTRRLPVTQTVRLAGTSRASRTGRLRGASPGETRTGRPDGAPARGPAALRLAEGVHRAEGVRLAERGHRAEGVRRAAAVSVGEVVIPFPARAADALRRSQEPDGFPPTPAGAKPRPFLRAVATHAWAHPEAERLAA